MIVYLASPMDWARSQDHRNDAADALSAKGASVYDPAGSWRSANFTDAQRVHDINMSALRYCSAVLGVLPLDVSSFGVPVELAYAAGIGIKTVAWTPGANSSLVMAALGVCQLFNLDEAVNECFTLS